MTVDIINDYTDNYFLSIHQVFCNFLNSGEYSMFECVCLCGGYVYVYVCVRSLQLIMKELKKICLINFTSLLEYFDNRAQKQYTKNIPERNIYQK